MQGYRNEDGYIATQHPLEETVHDFLKMVIEKKVVTIVMLNHLVEKKEVNVCVFFSIYFSLILNLGTSSLEVIKL